MRVEPLTDKQVDMFFELLKGHVEDENFKLIFEVYLQSEGLIKENETLSDVFSNGVLTGLDIEDTIAGVSSEEDEFDEMQWFAEIGKK